MKKFISILMCLILVCGVFAGCAKQEDYAADIVLITDGGTVSDGGYNQSAWEGVSEYAEENNMTCRYYQPVLTDGELTTDTVEQYVQIASDNGAQFIVLPGESFATPVFEIANSYTDVNFILVDAVPHSADDGADAYLQNVMSISFDTLESGFLAGYLAVLTGNTELGFFGEYSSDDSASYGAGFVQGAGWAADTLGIPVTVEWADYDSPLIDYDYNFTITACYEKIEDADEETFVVNVVNGIGSGTYTEGSNVTITADAAPEGQVFDHWEVQSDTEGVKDSKVNISSKSQSSMNLLVEKCDCTITAVYADIEGDYKTVTVMDTDGESVYAEYSVEIGEGISVTAPVAQDGLVFDEWTSNVDLGEDTDLTSSEIWVSVDSNDVVLTPSYTTPETPSFTVTVVTGEGGDGESAGSGSYQTGDLVEIAAAVPAEGYMFSHWENVDSYGNSTGISMDNEYYWNTTFEMVDRYAAVCKTMFDKGVTAVFDGGNSTESAYTAMWDFDYDLNVISAGANNGNAYSTIIKNYGEAVKDALGSFQGATVTVADCSTDGLYASYVSDDEDIQAQFDEIYAMLADGEITMTAVEGGAGYEFCQIMAEQNPYKCLTLNAWFLETIVVEY